MRRAWWNWHRRSGDTRLGRLGALAAFSLLVVVAGMGCGERGTPTPDAPATVQVNSSSDVTVQESLASARTAAGEPLAAPPPDFARPEDARVVLRSGAPGFGDAMVPGAQRSTAAAYATGEAATVEELLEAGLHRAGASPTHLAIRGTPAAGSVRCGWRGVARTTDQRADAIRFWLRLGPTDAIPAPAYLEVLFATVLDTLASDYRETAKANFLAIARGGESMDYLFLTCFADYAVTNFLLGTGTTPMTVTVAYDRMDEAASYDLYVREHDTGTYGDAALQTRGEYEAGLQALVVAALSAVDFATTGVTAVAGLEKYYRNTLKAYADIRPGAEGPRLHAAWATSHGRPGADRAEAWPVRKLWAATRR